MSVRNAFLAAVLATLFVPGGIRAQDRPGMASGRGALHVSGRVLDRSTGAALPSAVVRLLPRESTGDDAREAGTREAEAREAGTREAEARETGTRESGARPLRAREAVADSAGRFDLGELLPGSYELRVEALSYSSVVDTLIFAEIGSIEVRIEMAPAALSMEPLVVTTTRLAWLTDEGFYERRRRGVGITLTRSEIEAQNPFRVSDLFRRIPGAYVVDRTGRDASSVRLRGCAPQIVLDGAPFSGPVAIDEIVSPRDLEAVEVYRGPTGPVRYSTSNCGTVLIWTRRAHPEEGSPITWRRVLVTLGIVGLFTISAW